MNSFCPKKLFVLLLFTLVLSCDAPRQNPFDPNAVNYKGKEQTIIQVYNLYPPYHGLSNILVVEPNLHFSGRTGSDGTLIWEHEAFDSVALQASGEGFFPTQTLFKNVGKNEVLTIYMNAHPTLQDVRFISRYYSPRKECYLQYRSRIIDPDGLADLREAILFCDEFAFQDTLELEKAGSDYFESQFNLQAVETTLSPSMAPELSFALLVQNINGDSLRFEPFSIVRVIEYHLKQYTPAENDTVRGNVTFSWEEVNLGFPFTFTILLYQLPTELIATYGCV
ncbi:MAG TPA: hypothetical protein EYP36_03805 [Calditrichaeota bacterium]|nr:hypothetical protein [Calditrichota bacterium]